MAEHDAIVQHVHGQAAVIAGPGCGKTRACVDRAAALYKIVRHSERVLCVTFSVEAAAEMRKRISCLTGYSEKTLASSVATFHSLAFRILREEGLVEGRVLSGADVNRILRAALGVFGTREELREARNFIAEMRRALVAPDGTEIAPEGDAQLRETYSRYDALLRESRATDFDSMVYFAVDHLAHNAAAREKWQARFAFVIVDEAHDASCDQIELAKILAAPENNLMIVYDPSQSIYSFRGADPSNLKRIENPKIFYLSENHRSGQEIIDAFTPFAERDEASQELVRRMRAARDVPARIVVIPFQEEKLTTEAHGIAVEIALGGRAKPGDCAILARTRAELLPIAEELRLANVLFNWRGTSFWEERDIVRALSYCEYCANPKVMPRDTPRWHQNQLKMLADVAQHTAPAELLLAMRGEFRFGLSFDEDRADDFAQENFDALIRRAEEFKKLSEFLAHCKAAKQEAKGTQGVTLSTIHSAKGLEWKNVFLVGMSADKMPHPRSQNTDEERRLVYVALSRAKEYLWVSYAGSPSVFVEMLERRKGIAA